MNARLFSNVDQSPKLKLQKIMQKYDQLFKSNPNALRAAIPIDDVWRFFVEAHVQQSGRGFITNVNYGSYYSSHLNETIEECLNEQKRHLNDNVLQLMDKYKLFNTLNICHISRNVFKMKQSGEIERSTALLVQDFYESDLFEFLDERYHQRLTLKDITLLDKGWATFERSEPHYFKSLYNAFNELFSLNASVDLLTAIKTFHRISIDSVTLESKVKPATFRELGSLGGYCLTKNNLTLAGANYLINKNKKYSNFNSCLKGFDYIGGCAGITANELYYALHNNNDPYDWIHLRSFCYDDNFIADELRLLIKTYHSALAVAKTDLEKIKTIVTFILDTEQLHPFTDGNCRTIVMLTLNFLLKINGYPLALLENPNWFDGHSPDELVEAVIDGMQNVFELIEAKKVFGITTDDIISDLKLVNQPEATTALVLHNELNQIEANNRIENEYSLIRKGKTH